MSKTSLKYKTEKVHNPTIKKRLNEYTLNDLKIKYSFFSLFNSLLEVLEEFETVRNDNEKNFNINSFMKNSHFNSESELNPFLNKNFEYSSPHDFLKMRMNLLTIIYILEIEESTIIIAFMYIDLLLNKEKELIKPKSIEL